MIDLLLSVLLSLTGIDRSVDQELTGIAQQRVVEISSCPDVLDSEEKPVPGDCWGHAGQRSGTAEVLAWNTYATAAEAATRAVHQWMESPGHYAIVTNGNLGLIGCAHTFAHNRHYFVCVLREGTVVQTLPPPPSEAPVPLPDPVPAPTASATVVVPDQPLPDTAQEGTMEGLLPIPLVEIFTAPGVIAWASVITILVEFMKKISWIPVPDHGRGITYTVAGTALIVVLLAAWDSSFSQFANPTGILGLVLTWVAVATAAIGTFEASVKAKAIATGTTNPLGPDPQT